MAQFTLTWDNTEALANANAINQRASYRLKTVGGAWVTTGFTPANDMAVAETTTDTANSLTNNKVYEFMIETLCASGGPTPGDNGIQEDITFSCIVPTLTKTHNSAKAVVDLTGTDVSKVRFTLKRTTDNVVMGTALVLNVANSAELNVTGLAASTNYYWEIELLANVNNIEVSSLAVAYLGAVCGSYPTVTDANPVCDPTTSLTVTSIEL